MSAPFLNREEHIEQTYFFRCYRERLQDGMPSQEILSTIFEEVLATTKLPMAIEFLNGEILLSGRISDGMALLSHYFTPFQTFVMSKAEQDDSKFDQSVGLLILEREAEYLSKQPTSAGLFVYQFECISRNRLGYDYGMSAMAADPLFDGNWRNWILKIRFQLGTVDFGDLIYGRSEHFVVEQKRKTKQEDFQPEHAILFGAQEGRIAKANRGKDPLYLFAALQRQMGYPAIPKAVAKSQALEIHPALENRIQNLEKRLKLMEAESKGGIDLQEFMKNPPKFAAEVPNLPPPEDFSPPTG